MIERIGTKRTHLLKRKKRKREKEREREREKGVTERK
jgi:hypothetical protein